MDRSDSSENRQKIDDRWAGLILNLFAPGFGHLRAGNTRRGIFWFAGFCLIAAGAVFLVAEEGIPVMVGPAIVFAAFIWMMVDNLRPGEMSPRLCRVFFAMLAIAILLAAAARWAVRPFKIPTSAMEPTLMGIHDGGTPDQVIASRLPYLFGNPQRGDLMVFQTAGITGIITPQGESQFYVKRVVGLPGERIEIRDGKVFADGRRLTEADGIPPIRYTNLRFRRSVSERDGDAYIVGDDEYFVLGDFSENSADSRVWGNVPATNVQFKVTKIYWPTSRWGKPEWTDEVKPQMRKAQR